MPRRTLVSCKAEGSAGGGDRVNENAHKTLAFAAAHQLIVGAHVEALLNPDAVLARGELASLTATGLLSHRPIFHRQPPSYQITRRGLDALRSRLPEPRYELLHSYKHQIATAWLWLSAHSGALGPAEQILSEREMRAQDNPTITTRDAPSPSGAADDRGGGTLGVPVTASQPGKPDCLHYPDLMLIANERRVAFELQLEPASAKRLHAHIAAYGAAPNIAAVVYLVPDRNTGEPIRTIAAQLGLSAPTHVQIAAIGPTLPSAIAE